MSSSAMLRMKAVASSFYARMMRKKEILSAEQERAPITVTGEPCCERVLKGVQLFRDDPVDVTGYLSVEENTFLQCIEEEYQLGEDDLHLFHLVAYVRYVDANLMDCEADMKQPDFSPQCLTSLMECVQPDIDSSRGYYAAMLYLKNHPVPKAWRAKKNS